MRARRPDDCVAVFSTATLTAASLMPRHWTPEQALAFFKLLQVLRRALWSAYGPEVQRAWREQLVPHAPPPEFDPDEPF